MAKADSLQRSAHNRRSPDDVMIREQIELGTLMSEASLRDCIQIQRRARARGRMLSLREIAVMRGYLSDAETSGKLPVLIKNGGSEDGSTVYTTWQLQDTVSKWLSLTKLCMARFTAQPDESAGELALPFMPGQKLGAFKLLEFLGSGPLGAVYKAFNKRADKLCGLKVYPASSFADSRAQEAFKQRAKKALSLDHPNILKAYGLGTVPQTKDSVFVTRNVDGFSLRRALEKVGGVPEVVAIAVAIQTAEALACCHSQGIIHGNLKPENILFSRSGRVLLLDAGLERSTEHALALARSRKDGLTLRLAQSLNYVNPALARRTAFEAHDDIYSLGIILYEMITGRLPFSEAKDNFRGDTASFSLPTFDFSNCRVCPSTQFAIARLSRAGREGSGEGISAVVADMQTCLGQLVEVEEGITEVREVLDDVDTALDIITPLGTLEREEGGDKLEEQAESSANDSIANLLEKYGNKLVENSFGLGGPDAEEESAAGGKDEGDQGDGDEQ